MSDPTPERPAGRGKDGRFAKGNPGGPGRPHGAPWQTGGLSSD